MRELLRGYEGILWIQTIHNSFLDWLAVAASFLGTEAFYLLFVPIFYWCWSKRDGVRLAMVLLLSSYLISFAKELFHISRPDSAMIRVHYASSASGYSFPSGHAQNAVVFWGWLARIRPLRNLAWAIGALVLLISWSRIYLGLHFPSDVVGGWLLGGLVFLGLVVLDRRISKRPREWEGKILPWVGVILPLILFVLHNHTVQVKISGAMLGFCLGYLLESRWVQFSPRATWRQQIGKVLSGLSIGAILAFLLRVHLPQSNEFFFFGYAILGLWVSLGFPATYAWIAQRREEVDVACS
jgi:membrane-associated phospholipid phosphatase